MTNNRIIIFARQHFEQEFDFITQQWQHLKITEC
uniref:Uncharacterized protein n=1 Tax=Arundo donax TaxID=35708 RepID=A0A0A8YS22_ARUDO